MPAARQKRPPVPARSLFDDSPGAPGVYHSTRRLGERWVYFALGAKGDMLACHHPLPFEADADVVDTLWTVVQEELRPPALYLVNTDAIIAAGLNPALHRTFALPRLVR